MNEQAHHNSHHIENGSQNRGDSPFGYGIPSFQNGPLPPFENGNKPDYQKFNQNQQQNPYGNRRPGFGECVRLFFQRYTDFNGRSRRSEFWNIILLYVLIWFVSSFFGAGLLTLAWIVMLVPFIALQCRRLHDIGKSGHWIWLYVLSFLIFNVLTSYSLIYVLTYIPEFKELLEAQGLDYSDFYFLYPLLDIRPGYIKLMAVYVIVVNILFLVFNCMDSQPGTNQYGPSAKYPDGQDYYNM